MADARRMLNWLTRYAPAIAALEETAPLGSVLDVGCGQHGLACVRPEQPFVGFEIEYMGPVVETMVGFEGPAGRLPWKDASFDTVLCLDALEHVPRPDRASFVAELGRVAAHRVLIACPSTNSQRLDDFLRRAFAAAGAGNPAWLSEHFEHGLPGEDEIEAFVRAVPGFAASSVPMANGLLCTMIVLADMNAAFAPDAMAEYESRREAWTDLLADARFGPALRSAWMLERTPVATASVMADDLERTAVAALMPDAAVRRAGGGPVPRPRAIDTDASRCLWLAPDWERPETWLDALAVYVETTRANDDVCLCLDGSAGGAPPGLVASLAATACERLAGETDFGDVLVVEGPVLDEPTQRVHGPADVLAALMRDGGVTDDRDAALDALATELRGIAAGWRAHSPAGA